MTPEEKREKKREDGRAYHEANREKLLEKMRAYKEANREKIRDRSRAYKEANPEKIREQGRAHNEAGRERLDDWYVATILKLKAAETPPEMIEAKRAQVAIRRDATQLINILKEKKDEH